MDKRSNFTVEEHVLVSATWEDSASFDEGDSIPSPSGFVIRTEAIEFHTAPKLDLENEEGQCPDISKGMHKPSMLNFDDVNREQGDSASGHRSP